MAFIYVIAYFSVVTFPITIGTLMINPDNYIASTQPLFLAIVLYAIYVIQRLNRFSFKRLIWKSLINLFLVMALFLTIIIGIVIPLIPVGVLNTSDFTLIK